MRRIFPAIQPYAWGSHTFLAQLQGRPAPTVEPEAELWIGAHPSAPATLPDGRGLDEAIAADPAYAVGDSDHLTYLLKVLAAEKPLSLQAHPDKARAEVAFKNCHPSYVDANHKPELLVTLTQFDALCGFRSPEESADHLASLDIRPLDPVIGKLHKGDLRAAVEDLYAWDQRQREELVPWVAGAERDAGGGVAATLAEYWPYDVGVVIALLLNHVTLQPGEAIWMPAGNLHAYLRGAGVEIMAASDNVLRGGLTPKRVDVPELLRVLVFEPLLDPVVHPVRESGGVDYWPTPVDDFALRRIVLDDSTVRIGPPGGRITLCLKGSVTVADLEGSVTLAKGEAAFGNAGAGQLELTGTGEIYLASAQ